MRQTTDPPPEYGAWLRFHREEAGKTQQKLADDALVGYVSVNHLENDRRWATPEMADALARALNVSPDELFPPEGIHSPAEVLRGYLRRKRKQGKI